VQDIVTRKLQIRRFQLPHSGLTTVLPRKGFGISTNNLYCQKLRVIDLHFCCWLYRSMFITFHTIIFENRTPWV